MTNKLSKLFILLCFLSQNAFAEDQFLETCLRFAQARDKKLNVAQEQIALSQIRMVRSARAFLPQASLERKYSKGKTLTDEFQSEELGVRASQTIYEGGKIKSNYQYDSFMLDSARYNYTKAREDLFYKVKSSYYDYMTSKMEYTMLRKAFVEIDELSVKVKNEFKAKAISELDMIEAVNFRDKVENMARSAESNFSLASRVLASACGVESVDQIPAVVQESLPSDVPEISYILDECLNFVRINNIDLKINLIQIQMAGTKRKIVQSKVIPKVYLEGFFGRSGEAYVTQPLELATTWNLTGKVLWTFWGNSTEMAQTNDRALASDILDVGTRVDSSGYNIKLSIFDDLNYFVESKESKVGVKQAEATFDDTYKKITQEFEKSYNEYRNSLYNARTLRDEIKLKEKKLMIMKKKNQLYEVQTMQLMEETLKYAETITQYTKALATNYTSVSNMEKLTIMPLR